MSVQDSVIRMALASMAADATSPLTVAQRQWIIALPQRATPLTCDERVKLKPPLLAWVAQRQPRIADIVQRQFREDTPDAAD